MLLNRPFVHSYNYRVSGDLFIIAVHNGGDVLDRGYDESTIK